MGGRQGKAQLVFDLGMHLGEDAAYYLGRGYDVLGVDADPDLVKAAARAFAAEVAAGRLQLLHAAVVAEAGEDVDFYVSQHAVWNSLEPRISTRAGYTARAL